MPNIFETPELVVVLEAPVNGRESAGVGQGVIGTGNRGSELLENASLTNETEDILQLSPTDKNCLLNDQ